MSSKMRNYPPFAGKKCIFLHPEPKKLILGVLPRADTYSPFGAWWCRHCVGAGPRACPVRASRKFGQPVAWATANNVNNVGNVTAFTSEQVGRNRNIAPYRSVRFFPGVKTARNELHRNTPGQLENVG